MAVPTATRPPRIPIDADRLPSASAICYASGTFLFALSYKFKQFMRRSPAPANSEWLTRKQIIDGKLKSAGWKVVPFVAGKPLSAYERLLVCHSKPSTAYHASSFLWYGLWGLGQRGISL